MGQKFITFFLVFILLLVVTAGLALQKKQTGSKDIYVTIKSAKIKVELADTEEKIRAGLSGRDNLDKNSGMYFVFENKNQQTFWMKEMKFPIDIIWINNGKIVGIEKNAPLPTTSNIPTFTSPGTVTNVLEVNAGFSDINNIKMGDSVDLIK